MLRIQQIHLRLDEDQAVLPHKIISKLHLHEGDLKSWRIVRETFDARPRHLQFAYTIDCEVSHEERILKHNLKDVSKAPDEKYYYPQVGTRALKHRPIVVGFGPAGMFAALLLAQMGYQPLVLERGECVEKRVKSVEEFWEKGILNTESNVQFGEGGAGTFSDGKLTTRVKDSRIRKILEEFVRFGAPEDILYAAHPHIGTDLLRGIVKAMREEIIALGGEVRFSCKMEEVLIEDGHLSGVIANGETIPCEQLILAIGHSARDTMQMVMEKEFVIEPKAFAIGARIEHPQTLINKGQYKELFNHPKLKNAEYRLTYITEKKRGVHTFCMCPGGYVVPSTSIEGGVVVNGMSERARDGENANSALLVQIHPEDYGNTPQKAIAFQTEIEKRAFAVGGNNYQAPAQLVKDFIKDVPSTALGSVKPTYALGVSLCNLHDVLPDFVCEAMVEAIQALDHKLHGFAFDDAVLTGVETRSSSPIRMMRSKEDYQALQVQGVYPCGEGLGYAGGIVSAAIDGLRCAEQIIKTYHYE